MTSPPPIKSPVKTSPIPAIQQPLVPWLLPNRHPWMSGQRALARRSALQLVSKDRPCRSVLTSLGANPQKNKAIHYTARERYETTSLALLDRYGHAGAIWPPFLGSASVYPYSW